MFGYSLERSIDCRSLRALIGVKDYNFDQNSGIRHNNPFLIGNDPAHREKYKNFEQAIVINNVSTLYCAEVADSIEWTVSCLGHVVATIVVPMKENIIRPFLSPGKAVLIAFLRHGVEQSVVDALP